MTATAAPEDHLRYATQPLDTHGHAVLHRLRKVLDGNRIDTARWYAGTRGEPRSIAQVLTNVHDLYEGDEADSANLWRLTQQRDHEVLPHILPIIVADYLFSDAMEILDLDAKTPQAVMRLEAELLRFSEYKQKPLRHEQAYGGDVDRYCTAFGLQRLIPEMDKRLKPKRYPPLPSDRKEVHWKGFETKRAQLSANGPLSIDEQDGAAFINYANAAPGTGGDEPGLLFDRERWYAGERGKQPTIPELLIDDRSSIFYMIGRKGINVMPIAVADYLFSDAKEAIEVDGGKKEVSRLESELWRFWARERRTSPAHITMEPVTAQIYCARYGLQKLLPEINDRMGWK